MGAQIGPGAWLSGPEFGLADIGVLPCIDRLERLGLEGLWAAEFPRIGPWLAAMQARPSYAGAVAAFIPAPLAEAQKAAGARYGEALAQLWALTARGG